VVYALTTPDRHGHYRQGTNVNAINVKESQLKSAHEPADDLRSDDTLAIILRPYPKGSGSASTPHQRDMVIEALSNMQRQALADARLDANAIKTALKLALYTAGATNASQIVDNEQQVVDFVDRIFQTIFNDAWLTEPIKDLLSQLQIPVIKLALIDFAFLQDAAHPARRLLNGLVALSVGVTSKTESLFLKLQDIVSTIIDRFETELAPLEAAHQTVLALREMEARQSAKIEARFQREAHIEARRLAAKRKVVSTLNRVLPNADLPEEITTFILKCWAPYMAQTFLRHGADSEPWRVATLRLRQIVKAANRPGDIGALEAPLDSYFDQLVRTLTQAGCYADTQTALTQRAHGWFAQCAAGHVAPAQERMGAAPDEEDEPSQTQIGLRNLLSRVPAELTPGAWFEIYRGEGKAKRRLKLSVVLEATGRLLFADRTGRGVLEVELASFLQDLQAGRTILIDDSNRFDQALSVVIDSIRANQARQLKF
jgi:hypothetical protein